ncbi:MAG: flagellar basal body rod protein FlgC [Alphaproteobacteria bacterium]
MSNDIMNSMTISAMGMKVQGARLRVITENIANADTTGLTPGSEPYHRQIITFRNEMDKKMGVDLVSVDKISTDKKTPFPMKYIPDHPAADDKGMVKMPNVNSLIEAMDVREAQRSYEANLGMIEQARNMVMRTIDLLRA